MYMMRSRTSKVLSKIIMEVQRAKAFSDFHANVSLWWRCSQRRLCSSQAEDKYMAYSCKTLAQTKKEQGWCYDPTIKYESLRQCAVPRYVYYDDSTTDWSDSPASSDSEIETETEVITVEEAQTRKEKILSEARKEQPFAYQPKINYELLRQFVYIDSPESFASPPTDSETETPEEAEAKNDKFIAAIFNGQVFYYDPPDGNNKLHKLYKNANTSASKTDTETETLAQIYKDKILAGTEGEQHFFYDHSIKYEPLKRYIVPRFAFFDSSSTDWSASSDSESDTELVTVKEVQSQEDKIPDGSKEEHLFQDDLVKSPSTDLQYMAEQLAKSSATNLQSKPDVSYTSFLVEHGAKSPAEGSEKYPKKTKETDSCEGLEKLTYNDLNEGEGLI